MSASFFVARPVFAWVLSLCVTILGAVALLTLPVEQYPDIAPPGVVVTATYPGASAQTVEDSVTQILEQQIKGIDGLLYFSSNSSSSGQAQINLSFDQDIDPDIAQVQVQNAVNQALSRLPMEVQQQGLTVDKSQGDSLLVLALYDTSQRMTDVDISDYLVSNLQDPLSRVDGVGELTVFGSEYAMRIWLDPYKLASYGLMPGDVHDAIAAQNAQVTAGELGALPTLPDQGLNATVTVRSRFQNADQFRRIILRSDSDGSAVLLKDVAEVELGANDYQTFTRLNGYPASGVSVQLAPGANALDTARAIKEEVSRLTEERPEGLEVAYPRDSTPFVEASIQGVLKTLGEAVILVVIVMYIFLQSWRATLIPAVTVPIVLIGTFGVLAIFGYSINTLTLFAMVLAIGLLVDDAIVVVENVERLMDEENLSPRQATIKSMTQISSALVGIAVALSAVFLPMAFFSGSVGIIYRQFSITLVTAMILSTLVALTLSPALCSTLLRPNNGTPKGGLFRAFNRNFSRVQSGYKRFLVALLKRPIPVMVVFIAITALLTWQYQRMDTGFLPEEDQGSVMIQFSIPTGSPLADAERIGQRITDYFLTNEAENINVIFMVLGRSNAGIAQNVGMAFAELVHWDQRPGEERSARAIISRANEYFSTIREAQIQALAPAPVRGLGQSAGFELWLQDSTGNGREALVATHQAVVRDANASDSLTAVRVNGLEDKAMLRIDVDERRASALGLAHNDIDTTISYAWGGSYVNDFIDRGRVKRVYLQGDAAYRSLPDHLNPWHVRGETGTMTPFSSFASTHWQTGPQMLQRFNGLSASQIQGAAAADSSSGAAMAEMKNLIDEYQGYDLQWSGLSYQETTAGSQTLWLYVGSLLFVFLCLAALYESWSTPCSVLLVVPLGLIGAVLAANLAGYVNDIYFQVAMLTTIGLSIKNAILIVEFAMANLAQGMPLVRSILQASNQRLRPIIMTSLAFIAGVLPLTLSTGAGAASQKEIGVAVAGGMLSGMILSVLFVPIFVLVIQRLFKSRHQLESRSQVSQESAP
ncbi:efflux RND transporter permease subunit [Alloalcanivorax xenomutans]|jgi:multidrug efflux pump|uniref:efflux RND transporter permease subunit n=1 Tax=Alloalcanivorax xenomutans TaxID=1094342 RepID=UPI0003B85FAD|nr:efflux RND transporter permease subunit [Alloalcanivorax xenomutans]ERS11230.1 hypothetical protein Q668_19325 [Alcanivorax sp. PN-3]CUR46030.1 RND efflux system, inner membrane transporter CmeB [Alloalcanivorax xenomutans]